MKQQFSEIPVNIQNHLKRLVESSNLPDNEEMLDRLSNNWLEKENMFLDQIRLLGMEDAYTFSKDDSKGLIGITYSGSIVMLGPIMNGSRKLSYGSIKLRQDVPEIIKSNCVLLKAETGKDKLIELEGAPVQKTSSLFKLAVCKDNVPAEDQELRLAEVFTYLTNGFVDINNKTMIVGIPKSLENYTLNSMGKIVAEKNEISIKQTKQIIKDYLAEVEFGILNGKRVSLGNIGNISTKTKPPQKARLGHNPGTGQELLIKSKPEIRVPKISFSSTLKEKVK